jgi:hypothetical protein
LIEHRHREERRDRKTFRGELLVERERRLLAIAWPRAFLAAKRVKVGGQERETVIAFTSLNAARTRAYPTFGALGIVMRMR